MTRAEEVRKITDKAQAQKEAERKNGAFKRRNDGRGQSSN